MDELIKMLEQIYALLEQISAITTNQTTILLQFREMAQEENVILDMIENMVGYKDELITEVVNREQIFNNEYEHYRGKITESYYVKIFKVWVDKIMVMKNSIVEDERNNVLVMQNLGGVKKKQVEIPKTPNAVVEVYKSYQFKS